MDERLIEGIKIFNLGKFEDDRGAVLHMMKKNSDGFADPGEVYFSLVKSQVVKGWKLHKEMSQNFCVPVGQVKFVFFDDRPDSLTKGKTLQIEIGFDNYKLIHVPHGIWYSFKSISKTDSLIANCASIPHSKDESVNLEINNVIIPYHWQ